MKILIFNDTRPYHSGSEAVMDFIEKKLKDQGHELIGGYLNLGNERHAKEGTTRRLITLEDLELCDAVLVNGEGGGRASYNYDALARAQKLGKKTYLVNTIWHDTTTVKWRKLLPSLDQVVARGHISYKNLEKLNLSNISCYLDFSYFCEINEYSLFQNFNDEVVFGDFYEGDPEKDQLDKVFNGYPKLPMYPRDFGWSYLVKSLRTASIYITGRHHGMYAACKARTPFVLYKRENHKMYDMTRMSGVDIPVAQNVQELKANIEWTKNNLDVFQKLFNWIEEQPEWGGIREESKNKLIHNYRSLSLDFIKKRVFRQF